MKTDARVRYTKMIIKKSFISLLKERPINKITVKAICEMSEINRATFYKYYNDPFDLMEDIESVLGIHTCPINWPIGSGKEFKGVYDRQTRHIHAFTENNNGMKAASDKDLTMDSPELEQELGSELYERLVDDIELLDGASDELDMDLVSKGQLSPVFLVLPE